MYVWPYLAEIQPFENKINKNSKYWEKIPFKVAKMKSLAMHITNKKLSFDIFMVWNKKNIFMEHDLYLTS